MQIVVPGSVRAGVKVHDDDTGMPAYMQRASHCILEQEPTEATSLVAMVDAELTEQNRRDRQGLAASLLGRGEFISFNYGVGKAVERDNSRLSAYHKRLSGAGSLSPDGLFSQPDIHGVVAA